MYCGKECPPVVLTVNENIIPTPSPPPKTHGKAKLAHNLVVRLLEEL